MALEQAIKEALGKSKDNPEDLKEILSMLGININVPSATADKAEIQKWYDELKTLLTKKQEDVKNDKTDDTEANKPLLDKIASLEGIIGKLSERFENADKAFEAERKASNEKKVGDYIAEMEKDGRLAPKDDEKKKLFTELLAGDFEKQKLVFDSMPKTPAIPQVPNPANPVATTITDKRTAHEQMSAAAKEQIKSAIAAN